MYIFIQFIIFTKIDFLSSQWMIIHWAFSNIHEPFLMVNTAQTTVQLTKGVPTCINMFVPVLDKGICMYQIKGNVD